MMTASIARPRSASRLSANSAAKRLTRDSARAASAGTVAPSLATTLTLVRPRGRAQPHARIEHGVEHVDHEVDEDEDRHDHQQVGHDDRPVELVDRVDQQLAGAGPGEYRLGDDRECDHG